MTVDVKALEALRDRWRTEYWTPYATGSGDKTLLRCASELDPILKGAGHLQVSMPGEKTKDLARIDTMGDATDSRTAPPAGGGSNMTQNQIVTAREALAEGHWRRGITPQMRMWRDDYEALAQAIRGAIPTASTD